MQERISIAPMMEITDSHWRTFLRGLTRKTVLYTEMIVDQTILHNVNCLDYFIGSNIFENPSVIQIGLRFFAEYSPFLLFSVFNIVGGYDPELLSEATQIISQYGDYSEINLNAGCPSPRVSKRCFGAKLMLNPEHLREICSKMVRCSSVPITLKCRLGVDDHDSYDELTKLIEVVHSTGVRKFIIHARKCLLDGLTTKQNRDIPPLRCTMNIYYFNHFLFTDVSPINF
jgi:tRNA-dihydrouridine synthase A